MSQRKMSQLKKDMLVRFAVLLGFLIFVLLVVLISGRAHAQGYYGPFSGSESRTTTTTVSNPGITTTSTSTLNDSWSGLNYRPSSRGGGGRSWHGGGNRYGGQLVALGVGLVGGMLIGRAINPGSVQPRCTISMIPGRWERVWRQTSPSFFEASDVWVPEQMFRSCR